eukprot:TRINITY_DN8016_c0_g1_i1.p1 TRINITY_DN8016_c0_g1~~TRINITY_DN8016_c0_g1_i1.p1  ORF type:complete len:272 (-),score=19.15 TRINITY_DN8016_c0_g1_i1:52-867(-)
MLRFMIAGRVPEHNIPWDDMPPWLQRTATLGRVHSDTKHFVCDAAWVASRAAGSVRVRRLDVFCGEFVNGLQLHYEAVGVQHAGEQYFGNHHAPAWQTVELQDVEEIVAIKANIDTWMEGLSIETKRCTFESGCLKIITSEKRFGSAHFGNEPSACDLAVPDGHRFVTFSGGVGGHLHSIGLVFEAISWAPESHFRFSAAFHLEVKIVLMMTLQDPSGRPIHEECGLSQLPTEVVFSIIAELAQLHSRDNLLTSTTISVRPAPLHQRRRFR